jgi:hypothetical protein
MSVVIVVKVSEGLVLAADSAATLAGRIETPQGPQEGVLKTFFNARKLLQIGDFPIGLLTWGTGSIGARTIESLVRQWEYENNWTKQESLSSIAGAGPYEVATCAKLISNHLKHYYLAEYKDWAKDQLPVLGIVVAGYSSGKFFPEVWRFILPVDQEVHNQRPDINGKPDFGASWFGLTDSIVRLHFGRDELVPPLISEKFNIPLKDVLDALAPLQYQVSFAQMPLQDAIDYAHYMLNVAIGRFRFVIGPELCGGEVEIGAITQTQFNWIRRKSWKS